MFTQIVKVVSGTAGEALENRAYNNMLTRYGEDAMKAIVEPVLIAAGETWDSFNTYRRVKGKIQNDKISFVRAENEAKALSQEMLSETGMPQP